MSFAFGMILLIVSSQHGLSAVKEIFEGDSFETAVESLNPGDTLIVHAGTYTDSGRIDATRAAEEAARVVVEEAGAPIVRPGP